MMGTPWEFGSPDLKRIDGWSAAQLHTLVTGHPITLSADLGADNTDAEQIIRQLDNALESGAACPQTHCPAGGSRVRVTVDLRCSSVPGATTYVVVLRAYGAGTVGSWSSAVVLGSINVPNTTAKISGTFEASYADLGWTAGQGAQLVITRNPADAADDLAQIANLCSVQIEHF